LVFLFSVQVQDLVISHDVVWCCYMVWFHIDKVLIVLCFPLVSGVCMLADVQEAGYEISISLLANRGSERVKKEVDCVKSGRRSR
jgi:hypothetical protein